MWDCASLCVLFLFVFYRDLTKNRLFPSIPVHERCYAGDRMQTHVRYLHSIFSPDVCYAGRSGVFFFRYFFQSFSIVYT